MKLPVSVPAVTSDWCTVHFPPSHSPAFTAVCASYLISHPEMSQPPLISRYINHPSCPMIGLKPLCAVIPHFAQGKSLHRALLLLPPLTVLHAQPPLINPPNGLFPTANLQSCLSSTAKENALTKLSMWLSLKHFQHHSFVVLHNWFPFPLQHLD